MPCSSVEVSSRCRFVSNSPYPNIYIRYSLSDLVVEPTGLPMRILWVESGSKEFKRPPVGTVITAFAMAEVSALCRDRERERDLSRMTRNHGTEWSDGSCLKSLRACDSYSEICARRP